MKKLLFTFDDGYTAIVKVWEVPVWFGRKRIMRTVHPRK